MHYKSDSMGFVAGDNPMQREVLLFLDLTHLQSEKVFKCLLPWVEVGRKKLKTIKTKKDQRTKTTETVIGLRSKHLEDPK